jgi:serine/threonine-protein kinase
MSDVHLLQPGTQLDGRYEVLRLLGQGGMAAVYQVRHLGLHSLHALKVLNPELARDDEIRGRFLSEGRIQARMRHPHIVQVTEIVTSPVAGLVMDYVEGPTLGDFCRAGPKPGLSPEVLLEVFLPVLDAVEEAHHQGVIHRDLKPDNIIIGKDNRGRLQPMVTDFGIAKLMESETTGAKARTRAGVRMGTLPYMSPEQIRGAGEVDARTDIFSLGAILYEAATGQVAFDAQSEYETMRRIVEGDFVPLERAVGGLPPVIGGCIRKALAVDPAERFQDCASFRAALEKALEPDAPVPAKPSRSFAVTEVGPRTPAAPEPAPARAPTPVPAPIRAPAPAPAPPRSPTPVASRPVFDPSLSPGALTPKAPPPARRPAVSPPRPQARAPRAGGKKSVAPDTSTSPGLALLLSFLCIPGFGQIYNKQAAKGACILLSSMMASLLLIANGHGCLWFGLNILFAVDAFVIAGKRKKGQPVGEWEFF